MRASLVFSIVLFGCALVAACDDPPSRLVGTTPREAGDTTDVPDDTTDIPADTVVSAAEAAVFVVEAAAILTAYSDPDDAFATFGLAGGAGARGAIQPPADSLPEQVCTNPRDPEFYEREHRGLTYVWDPVRRSYVYSTEAGAPICSIRIARYALDAGFPIVPLERLGYIEVSDHYAPGPVSGISFLVVSDTGTEARTLTAYHSTKFYQFYSRAYEERWTLGGFFDRDGDRLDFLFSQLTSSSSSPGASYHHVSGSSAFSGGGVELTTSRSPTAYTLTVRHGDRTVEFHMEKPADGFTLVGEIRTTGSWSHEGVVGTITGSPDAPTFLDNLGGALPAEVESRFASFWASLLGQFGLHRWPHV